MYIYIYTLGIYHMSQMKSFFLTRRGISRICTLPSHVPSFFLNSIEYTKSGFGRWVFPAVNSYITAAVIDV